MSFHCPLDRVIRGTFEWREVANILSSHQLHQPGLGCGDGAERIVGECVYRSANALAHRDRHFANFVVRLLDRVHADKRRTVAAMELDEIDDLVAAELTDARVGWLWALLTDRRKEVVAMGKSWATETVG